MVLAQFQIAQPGVEDGPQGGGNLEWWIIRAIHTVTDVDAGERRQSAEDDRESAKLVLPQIQLPEVAKAGQLDRETTQLVVAEVQLLQEVQYMGSAKCMMGFYVLLLYCVRLFILMSTAVHKHSHCLLIHVHTQSTTAASRYTHVQICKMICKYMARRAQPLPYRGKMLFLHTLLLEAYRHKNKQ
jgi:hypothetical protein